MEPMKNIFLVLGFSALLGIFIFEVLETQEERKIAFIDPTIQNNTVMYFSCNVATVISGMNNQRKHSIV